VRTGRRRAFALLGLLAVGGLIALAQQHPVRAGSGSIEQIDISARQIENFRIGSAETRFGPLEFVGGLELTSGAPEFGGMSGFRFLTPGADFIGVADTGYWFFGTVARDADGRPSGFSAFRAQPIQDPGGSARDDRWGIDAEGLAVQDCTATVSFERAHRIEQYAIDRDGMKPPVRKLDFLVPRRELRTNQAFETVAHAHRHGQHEGAIVAITERSLDRSGNLFAAILQGPNRGIFTVRRSDDFDITDGAFLPNGDLLLLERSFSFTRGVRMRLRRIYGESIVEGAVADGPVLFEAGMAYQIDNMEGLDVWTRKDGAQMVSIVSDDNRSIIQRNLYLEFILHDEAAPQPAGLD
jgi:hypothetical protein